MSGRHNIESGGERVGKAPSANLRLEPMRSGSVRRPSKVRRRPISFCRRNERRRLRDAIDWGYMGYVVAVVATGLVALHVAMGGGL